jgi:signal transduction histidine kinase/DNA-binding response OmpR family regulator
MSLADQDRLLRLVEKLQRDNERLRQQAKSESHSRLMAEDALGKTEDRLQLALDAAGLAMWEWRILDDTLFTAARFASMIGGLEVGDADDRIWSTQELLTYVFAQDRSAINQALAEVLKQTTPRLDIEFRVATPNGPVWIECLGEVVQRSMLGQAEILVGVIRDVTRRREIQLEIETARAQAVAANAAKDEFLAHMSHEIRTPLNGVLGMNSLLAKTGLSPEQRQYVELVGSSGQALLALVNDLLDYSRLQAHKLVLEQVRFPLRRWLWQVVEPQRLAAQAKGLELLLQTDEALPPEMVGDPGRLRQVVINLLTNAIKFTDKGRIDVAMQLQTGDDLKPYLQLQVKDTGIGIAPEKQQLVFGAFAQADSSTSRRFGGSGLGLSICERLVGLMGGSIRVDSRLGEGSCFTVQVPLGESRDDIPTTQFGLEGFDDAKYPAPNEEGAQPELQSSALQLYGGMQALVVDDHMVNQLLASKLLQRLGFVVAIANDGAQAVQAISRGAYDLVLMDIQMPHVDGRQATQQVRQWEHAQQKKRTTIIALSAHASATDRDLALASGMDGYLSKPLLPDALRAALASALRGNIGKPAVLESTSAYPTPTEQAPTDQAKEPQVVNSVFSVEGAVVNRARLLARLAGDEALLHTMAQAFCVDLRDRMGLVHVALKKQDWRTVGAHAHALAGALSTLTAQAAAREAKVLEQAALAQDIEAAKTAFTKLSAAAKEAYDVVKLW